MKIGGLQPLQQLRYWQRSDWWRVDVRLPLGCGTLMLGVLLAALLADVPWVAGLPLLGFLLLAAYQGYRQPTAPFLVAATICMPLFLMVLLLAWMVPDGRIAAIWLAIALFTLLLCLVGAFASTWLQSRRHGI